ncbi:MAG: DNA (cytosine-5-)-methyltransferase, partial [Emcibacteraceae bacterium]|nr:DNA (cytosine-5-)-methyltransferase [Emcibacteraceae bacterium]
QVKDGPDIWQTEPKWVNDFCNDSCETWENNVLYYERQKKGFENQVKIIQGDVRKLRINSLAPVDGLMFGFPCNDFSLVGEKKGFDGEFGPLYSYGVKILKKKRKPSWFIAENVGGITSANKGNAFSKILKDLQDSGYRITAHKYKLEEYGIPQARHRVIIVGFRNDLKKEFKVPAPSKKTKTAEEALHGIPEDALNNELTRQSATVIERLSYIKPGENCWNAKGIPERLKLNVPRTQLSHIYKKINPKKPSYTVTGSGGGGTHMYHWAENRALTNRERARLQTFPDWFEFHGSKESVRKQIGMAIPVDAARIIVEAVLKTMAGIKYKHVNSNIQAPINQ